MVFGFVIAIHIPPLTYSKGIIVICRIFGMWGLIHAYVVPTGPPEWVSDVFCSCASVQAAGGLIRLEVTKAGFFVKE
jgi:hypothetical protein